MTDAGGAPPRHTPAGIGRPSRSIVRRLMLALTVSIALASVGAVLGLAVLDTRREGAELEHAADEAVRELARVAEPALWDLDMDRAGQIGGAFAEDPRVVRLVIRENTTGEVREVTRGPLTDTIARILPVTRDGRLLGTVGLTFTRESLRRAVREQVTSALRASLVALLVAFLVVRLLVRRLLDAPLDELAASVAAYDQGADVVTPATSPYEEFETLHEVLHAMRTRLAHQLRELRSANFRLTGEITSRQHTEEALRHRNRELASLNRFLDVASTEVPADFLVARASEELAAALDLPFALAALAAGRSAARLLVTRGGDDTTPAEGRVVDMGQQSLAGELAARRGPLVLDDAGSDARLGDLAQRARDLGVHSVLVMPVMVDGDMFAAIAVGADAPHAFTEAEVALAVGLATQAASAIAHYRANAAQRLLRAAIEQSPDAVLITDTDGGIVYANESFSAMTGYSREETVGATPRILRSGQHPAEFYATMWETLRRGETWRGRITNRRADGREIVQDAIIAPVRDEGGTITNYIANQSDITQELAREERFRHAQRMDAVGQLAGGIAHDFNNILGAINLELELLELEHDLPAGVARVVHDVRSSAQRAANLTRQLLMFSRRQVMTMRPHDLNVVVRDLLRMLSRVIGERVTIDFQPAARPAVFEGDAGMIEQVVMNLCVNARDAMPAGGTLAVRIDDVELEASSIPDTDDAEPGRYLRLRISDTGTGMSAETRSRLFEPFFTTKDVGKGTGLGLATAHGLVAQHHGFIAVESAPGQGSTFDVYLPASSAGLQASEAGSERPRAAASAATVMLVEDEAAVRKVIGRSLRRLGYRVIEVSGGADALDVWAGTPAGEIQLLLTDMVMPEQMSGLDLAVRLRAMDQALKVVIMSGYDVRLVGDNVGLINDIDFLGKPFTITALGEVVTRLLGGPPEGAAGPGGDPGVSGSPR